MPTKHSPLARIIAEAYGVTRVRLYQLANQLDLPIGAFRNPETVFGHLLERRQSRLRQRLSNPAVRESIRHQLQP